MESFNYEVVLPDGKSKTGTIEAQNLEAAKAKLSSNGNLIVNIAQANALNKDLDIHIGKAVKARELGVFCRQFESILNAGVPVITALDMLSNQTENKTFKNTIKNVSGEIPVTITLKGLWKVTETPYCQVVVADRKQTVLRFTCRDAVSLDVELKR